MEAMIYMVIGVTAAFLLTSALIYTVCHCINRPLANAASASKLDDGEQLQPQQPRRSSSRQTFNRQSYLQQSPMTEETISLDDFDRGSVRGSIHSRGSGTQQPRRSLPKLIYTQEFTEGLMVLPKESELEDHIHEDARDDSLAPLASFDGDDNCVGPHQFVLRRPQNHQRHPRLHPNQGVSLTFLLMNIFF